MQKHVKQILANDISKWHSEGWISFPTMNTLGERYDVKTFSIEKALKYLGTIGGIFIFFGIMAFISLEAHDEVVGAMVLLLSCAGFLYEGYKLYRDPLNRHPYSSQVLMAIALLFLGGAIILILDKADVGSRAVLIISGLFWLTSAFTMAYRFRNSFILTIAVLVLFHWLGSWNQMVGRSTYVFSVQDPRAMAVAAFMISLIGLVHQYSKQVWKQSFATVYIAVSLVYLNMSVLILSIFDKHLLVYVAMGLVLCILQVVAGARFKLKIYTGFGMTFMSIHLFTRYYERFWVNMDKGLFFLLGGLILLAIGVVLEAVQRKEVKLLG